MTHGRQYNAGMQDEPFELSDVLARLKRADESLAEFVAPLWPGVKQAAAWIEGRPRLLRVADVPSEEGYYLLKVEEDSSSVLRPAEDTEIRKYLGHLTKASVILLDEGLAYPASSIERLQGITCARPIHLAHGEPLQQVQARFDGLNIFYDSAVPPKRQSDNPLEELFAGPSIMMDDELFGIPGQEAACETAAQVLDKLHASPELYTEYRLRAVLETAGAILEDWSRKDNILLVNWRLLDERHSIRLTTPNAPITSGISLANARTFDPATLIRLLHEHLLDGWR